MNVILFGTIPTKIPIVSDIPTDLPTTPELPAVSPFLYLDDSESDPESEPVDELLRDMYHLDLSVLWFLVMTPARSAALHRARQSAHSSESSSSSTSSGSSSDSASNTSKSYSTASLHGTQISLEDRSYHSYEATCSLSGPLTHRRPHCSDYATPTSSSSVGPSRKRSRSLATSVPSTVHTARALSLARADLLPPHKRYKDIEVETAAVAVIVDGLGIEPIMAVVETGFEPGLAVVESKIEPEEAEADDEADAEIQPDGTVEIGVDVTTRIDIPNDLLMSDAIERL
ncbi:hypothetical protein Tco_0369426 [Tanacetum coccineum]